MNWTGGNLQRHSRNGGKVLVQRQRAHFAKVRASPQNTPSQIPDLQPVFFTTTRINSDTPLTDSRLSRRLDRQSPQPESIPQPHRTHSIRQSERYTEPKRDNERYKRRRIDGLNQKVTDHNRQPSVVTISSTSSANSSTSDEEEDRKNTTKNLNPFDEVGDVDTARQKLLRQGDWLGLRPARPLHVRYKSSLAEKEIGKRHRIDSRKLTTHRRDADNLIQKDHRTMEQRSWTGREVRVDNVDVRIGSCAILSKPVDDPLQNCSTMTPARREVPSDSMLLSPDDNATRHSWMDVDLPTRATSNSRHRSKQDYDESRKGSHSSVFGSHDKCYVVRVPPKPSKTLSTDDELWLEIPRVEDDNPLPTKSYHDVPNLFGRQYEDGHLPTSHLLLSGRRDLSSNSDDTDPKYLGLTREQSASDPVSRSSYQSVVREGHGRDIRGNLLACDGTHQTDDLMQQTMLLPSSRIDSATRQSHTEVLQSSSAKVRKPSSEPLAHQERTSPREIEVAQTAKSPNEMWIKFVFGSDNTNEGRLQSQGESFHGICDDVRSTVAPTSVAVRVPSSSSVSSLRPMSRTA